MRPLLTLVYLLLSLVGCDLAPGNRIDSQISIDGDVVLHTLVEHRPTGRELFRCVVSATGQCHFLVYAGTCARGADEKPEPDCVLRTLEKFTIAAGQSKSVAGLLPGFHVCTSREAMPVVPACAVP